MRLGNFRIILSPSSSLDRLICCPAIGVDASCLSLGEKKQKTRNEVSVMSTETNIETNCETTDGLVRQINGRDRCKGKPVFKGKPLSERALGRAYLCLQQVRIDKINCCLRILR